MNFIPAPVYEALLGEAFSCCARTTIDCLGRSIPVNFPRVMHFLILASLALLSWLIAAAVPFKALLYLSPLSDCDSRSCAHSLLIERTMAALFFWHLLHAIILIGVKSRSSRRYAPFYSAMWGPRGLLLLGMIALFMFGVPSGFFVSFYNWLSLVGAAIFLLFQAVLLVDFANLWAACWVQKADDDSKHYADGPGADGWASPWLWLLMIFSGGMFVFSIAADVITFALFGSGADCAKKSMHVALAIIHLLFTIAGAVSSILPIVKEQSPNSGLLQSAVVAAYTSYLHLSAFASEPEEWTVGCPASALFGVSDNSSTSSSFNPNDFFTAWSTTWNVVGVFVAIFAAGFGAVSFSVNSQKLTTVNEESTSVIADAVLPEDERPRPKSNEQDVPDAQPEGYERCSFVHIAFGLAAMYVQQLLTNWSVLYKNSHEESSSLNVGLPYTSSVDFRFLHADSGPAAVWIKVICSWVVSLLYLWSLYAPVIFPDRDFGNNPEGSY